MLGHILYLHIFYEVREFLKLGKIMPFDSFTFSWMLLKCVRYLLNMMMLFLSKQSKHKVPVHTDTWVYKNSKHEFCVFGSNHAL